MYRVTARLQFSGAHHLREYPGKCQQVHGHNWEVEAAVSGRETDRLGMLVDFGCLKAILKTILDELDHRDLNSLSYFYEQNPTAENISRFIFERLKEGVTPLSPELRVDWVRVWETPGCGVAYWEDET